VLERYAHRAQIDRGRVIPPGIYNSLCSVMDTPARVEAWRQTSKKPSPVMVWTPEQAGHFLDYVAEDRLYALWHTAIFRGPRRGELCGLPLPDVASDYSSITVTVQLTEVDYEIEEARPKSESGRRVVALDKTTGTVIKRHLVRQKRERLQWGEAWVDSGRVFTEENGEQLRPSKVSDRFTKLVAECGWPPIRFHDLRHVAATLALAAGVDMKVIQEMLGHASLSVTSDLYSSVLPDLALSAAEAAAALVPRAHPETDGHTSATPAG
jgi:integrase